MPASIKAVAKPVVRQRIALVTSKALGEILRPFEETGMYTFERLTGAVEHRDNDGQLLAISLKGKHYIDSRVTLTPSPLRLVQ